VRLSETGPTATAFWRGALALPLLALWAAWDSRGTGRPAWRFERGFAWAGALFAGDLLLWHWALVLTSVAAATLEANLAPVFVTLFAWLLWRQRPRAGFVGALLLAMAGVLLIVAPKLQAGGQALVGDLLGIGTAMFYAGYIMAVAQLRARVSTGVLMFHSTLVFTVLLLPIALAQDFAPETARGWLLLLGLALFVHVLGQGLIAYALAHLPAAFGALGLYLQPLAAAIYAWWLLGERLEPVQLAGGVVVLVAIGVARRAQVPVTSRAPQ
jgi:drug/metabolite transporter (DMT)-like permease